MSHHNRPHNDLNNAQQDTSNTSTPSEVDKKDGNQLKHDTRLDESKGVESGSKPGADSTPASDADRTQTHQATEGTGVAGNNAVDTPSAAPTSGVNGNQEVTPGTDPDVPGAHQGNQPDASNANSSKDHKANDGADADTSSKGHADSSAADDKQNGEAEAEKVSNDKNASAKDKKEAKERAADPSKSVTDPDFNADSKLSNPDDIAGTQGYDGDVPLKGDGVTPDDAVEAGAPLGANTTDADQPGNKSEILAAAKQRVKEQNAGLQKSDPAAYKEAVRRAILDLTNGDPDATSVITKHWDDQVLGSV